MLLRSGAPCAYLHSIVQLKGDQTSRKDQMAENRKWEQTIGAGYLLGISALALLLALPLLKPEFNIGRLSLKAGTQPYGWPQGITKNPADCYLVIGDWYWFIGYY
jgi:hypothetical protein